jgi:hypothetical protein
MRHSPGKLVATYKVYEAADLRTVDCATDGRNVYVAWDRFTNTPGTIDRAFWARLRIEQNAGSPYVRKWGPYQVGNGVGCLQYDPGATYAGRPRIAYEPGGHVLVVFAQLSPSAGPNGCPLCTETFVGATGELIWWDDIWAQGNETSFDVEWAVNAFIVLRLFRLDGAATGDYMSTTVGSDGSIMVEHQWLTYTGDYYPTDDARLVYTPNARNPNYQTIGMVDSRNFWLYANGMLSGWKDLYRTDWVGCEYWGPNPRTSQVYSVYYPNSALVHDHTPTMVGTALDSYSFTSRIPLACSSSDVFADQEVLVVVGFAGLARVYWNFEPED